MYLHISNLSKNDIEAHSIWRKMSFSFEWIIFFLNNSKYINKILKYKNHSNELIHNGRRIANAIKAIGENRTDEWIFLSITNKTRVVCPFIVSILWKNYGLPNECIIFVLFFSLQYESDGTVFASVGRVVRGAEILVRENAIKKSITDPWVCRFSTGKAQVMASGKFGFFRAPY